MFDYFLLDGRYLSDLVVFGWWVVFRVGGLYPVGRLLSVVFGNFQSFGRFQLFLVFNGCFWSVGGYRLFLAIFK